MGLEGIAKAFAIGVRYPNFLHIDEHEKLEACLNHKPSQKQSLSKIFSALKEQLETKFMSQKSITHLNTMMVDLKVLKIRYEKRTRKLSWKIGKWVHMLLVTLRILKINRYILHENSTIYAIDLLESMLKKHLSDIQIEQ